RSWSPSPTRSSPPSASPPDDPPPGAHVMTLLAVLASCIAIGAAARSTWSPCGLSMLSTITPMAERSRGRRWGLTASWFVLGAVLGGATLGLLAVLGALAVGAMGLSTTTLLGLAAAAALVAAAMDL